MLKSLHIRIAALAILGAASLGTAQTIPSGAEWFAISGSDSQFVTWQEGSDSFYAISLDGGRTIATIREADYTLKLRYAQFDPAQGEPEVPAFLQSVPGSDLHLIQYMTQGLEAHRSALEAYGVELLQFVSNYGHVARIPQDTLDDVASLPFVRWIGSFHPAYRTEDLLRKELIANAAPSRTYNIHVTRYGISEKLAVAAHISAMGGIPDDYISPHGYLLKAHLNGAQLLQVLQRDDVLFVDRWGPEEEDMDKARILFGADHVENVAGYTGAGVVGEVRDSGVLVNHQEFTPAPMLHGSQSGSQSHGTSVYGIVFADGVDPSARGVLPDGTGWFLDSGLTTDRFQEHVELLQPPIEAVFQTNSTGSPRTFFYTTISADMDNTLFMNQCLTFQSQSNAGNQDSRPQAWAKNIISCGGVRHVDTLTTNDDNWSGGGSIGPAQDGRIKPDLSAFYDNIRTTSSSSPTSYTNTFGGTSGATPITAGHSGLFFQMWSDGVFGNPVTGATVFDNRPEMATAKAMLINQASPYAFSGATSDLTRVHQGWGRVDVAKIYDRRDRVQIINETDILTNLGSSIYQVNVTPADPEFRATLVFIDPPGNPAAAEARINDLTLRVTDPNGTVYFGNNGLLVGNSSTSGGVANTVDTVENVWVPNPPAGMWTVEVIASEINQDSHLETGAVDADYALVVSGVDPPLPPVQDVGQPNSMAASMRINGSININGFGPNNGINGPFFANLGAGQQLTFTYQSLANYVFVMFLGPLNRNNAIFPGVGSLDIGLMGPSNLGDVAVVLDGFSGTGFFDLLGNVGADGQQVLSFPITGAVPPGIIGTFQSVMFDPANSITALLTAATEVTIN